MIRDGHMEKGPQGLHRTALPSGTSARSFESFGALPGNIDGLDGVFHVLAVAIYATRISRTSLETDRDHLVFEGFTPSNVSNPSSTRVSAQ